MGYQSSFDLRAGETNYGKILVVNSSLSPVGTEKAYVGIEGPTGTVKAIDPLTADIDLGLSDNSLLVDIPVDSEGEFITGIYTITVQEVHPTYGNLVYNYQFDFCPVLGSPALSFVTNCVCAKAVVTDATVYGDGGSVTRTMTIIPPTIPGASAPTNIETSSASYTINLTHSNVKYQVNLEVELTQNPIEGILVLEEISYAEWFTVVCDYDLCGLISCVNQELSWLDAKAQTAGGYKNLPVAQFDRLIGIQKLLFKHNALVTCQDYAGVQAVYNELKALIDCSCGCNSNSAVGPQPLSSACASGSSSLAISATSPITATLVGSTWQLAFNASYKAGLDALRLYHIQSTKVDLAITSAFNAGTNTQTFDVNLRVNSWNTLDQDEFTSTFSPDSASVQSAFNYRRMPGDYIECVGQIRIDKAITTGAAYNLLTTALAEAYRPTEDSPWYPIISSTGVIGGSVKLTSSGHINIYVVNNWFAVWGSDNWAGFSFMCPKTPPDIVNNLS